MEVNRIYKGDCLELMAGLADKSVDMILCDLPYGVSGRHWDKIIDIGAVWEQYNRIIKDDGAVVLTATMKFAIDLINANRANFRYELIWKKTMPVGFANSHRMPLRAHEHILVFYKKLPKYNPQGLVELPEPKTFRKRGSERSKASVYKYETLNKPFIRRFTNYPRSVIEFSNANHYSQHPTQKPLDLFEYLIKTFTDEGELVLDNCVGSGTTAVACINTGRRFIGIEKDERFFDMACERARGAREKACCETEKGEVCNARDY